MKGKGNHKSNIANWQEVVQLGYYAGLLRRVLGFLIDASIFLVVFSVYYLVAQILCTLRAFQPSWVSAESITVHYYLGWVLLIVVPWLYFSLFESSSVRGTPGKLIQWFVVVAGDGNRITVGRATVRYFAKAFTVWFTGFIGFLLAAWTKKNQAPHDVLARTVVLSRSRKVATGRCNVAMVSLWFAVSGFLIDIVPIPGWYFGLLSSRLYASLVLYLVALVLGLVGVVIIAKSEGTLSGVRSAGASIIIGGILADLNCWILYASTIELMINNGYIVWDLL